MNRLVLALMLLGGGLALAQSSPVAIPMTPKRPSTDTYHGIRVTEDYRWLEQTDRQEVKTWVKAQNQVTRRVLDADPMRESVLKELRSLQVSGTAVRHSYAHAGRLVFALREQAPQPKPALVVLKDVMDLSTEKVIVDLNLLDPTGKTEIDWYVPSHDASLVAVSLSKNGSEDGTLFVYETATGKARTDVIPRVNQPTGAGAVAWEPNGKGFYYTRYPRAGERPTEDLNFYIQIYRHELGRPTSEDRYVLGKEFPRIAEIQGMQSTVDGWLLVHVQNGDGEEHAFHVMDPKGNLRRIASFTDGIRRAVLGKGKVFAISNNSAPKGKLVAMDLPANQLGVPFWKVVVPESTDSLQGIKVTENRIHAIYGVGGPLELRTFDQQGKPLASPGVPPVSMVYDLTPLQGDAVLFWISGYLQPMSAFIYDPARGAGLLQTVLCDRQPFSAEAQAEYESIRSFAVSKDGTRVPLNILRKKGLRLDGSHPVLLTGYGGYGFSRYPFFVARNLVWLRHGGVWVEANLRGGGEFGAEWHRDGRLTKKQNVFDDFLAGAQFLIDQKYTTAKRLAIEGGSNGGLLMGAALTQRPDLFAAVVSHVGWYDMLRTELTPNGAFNTTEFGSVKDPEQFKALYAYSPYHRVQNGVAYPPVLLTTGVNDGRVDPWQSYKMAARIQAAGKGNAILLRVGFDSGHGGSSPEEDADTLTFLFRHLGMK